MNANAPSAPEGSNDAYPPCGRRWGRAWAFWPVIPFVVFGGFLLLAALAWEFGSFGWWGGRPDLFWPIFPLGILFVFLLVFVVFRFAWGGGWHDPRSGSTVPSAEEILRQRYARGEIGEPEYRERLRVLGSSKSP